MNRTARRHLLACLERAAAPLHILTVRARRSPEACALLAALGKLSWAILPVNCKFEIMGPRSADVRVVAGKGARRRGVRGRIHKVKFNAHLAFQKLLNEGAAPAPLEHFPHEYLFSRDVQLEDGESAAVRGKLTGDVS